MKRNQKEKVVTDLQEKLSSVEASFLVNYKGLDVNAMQKLRTGLREQGAEFRVSKARLMIRAVEGVDGGEGLKPLLKEQVGLVFTNSDPAAAAKVLIDFSKTNKNLGVIASLFSNKVMSQAEVKALASLPSREVLIAQLAGVLNAPIVCLARSLNEVIASLPRVLNEVVKKG